MNWWDRIAKLLHARGETPADLARASGVPVKLVYKYMEGNVQNPRGDTLGRIASALDISEQELRYGVPHDTLVELKRIPLLRMNEIGTLSKGQSALDVWDGVSMVSVPANLSNGSFGVQLVDGACSPDFQPNDVIICEPLADISPGKFVVAVLETKQQGYFRRYRPTKFDSSDHFRLVATNPDFPDIAVDDDNPGFVIARATKHIRDI